MKVKVLAVTGVRSAAGLAGDRTSVEFVVPDPPPPLDPLPDEPRLGELIALGLEDFPRLVGGLHPSTSVPAKTESAMMKRDRPQSKKAVPPRSSIGGPREAQNVSNETRGGMRTHTKIIRIGLTVVWGIY